MKAMNYDRKFSRPCPLSFVIVHFFIKIVTIVITIVIFVTAVIIVLSVFVVGNIVIVFVVTISR